MALAPSGLAATVGNSAPQTGRIVSEDPANNTPHILNGTVYSVVQVGNTVIVGGSFTQVRTAASSTVISRNRVFAFDATSGAISSAFNPGPNGTVYKVQAATDGASVYVGGGFTSAAGRSIKNLFKMNVATGALDTGFTAPNFSGNVRDLEVIGNRLYVAGKFTHIGGRPQKALGTINASTGAYDSYFSNVLAGLHRTGYDYDVTDVLQMSSNPQNTELTAVGNFTSVDGKARSQIVTFDLTGASSRVSDWYTNLFTSACSSKFDTYMSDVEYSPNGEFFVVSTSGAFGGTSGSNAGTVGCDVVARFESGGTTGPTPASWTAYTGGDTTWTVEVTDNVVYAGGHQRWQNNPGAGDSIGPGAVSREGIAALNTVNGMAYSWNPTRTRGVGIQDMLATPQGLWVGSDTDRIGAYEYHGRIALLPLAGGDELPAMVNHSLPADVYNVSASGSQLNRRTLPANGAPPAPAAAPNGSVSWGSTVGAFMVNGVLYTGSSNGDVTKRTFNGTTYGAASPVNASDLLSRQTTWHDTDVRSMTSLFYYRGVVYFTRSGQTGLYRRGFEVESDVVGQQKFTVSSVSGINFANIRGAFVADGKFYYADTNGRLFRATWAGHAPVAGTSQQVSGPGIDSQNWSSRSMFVYQGSGVTPPPPTNQPPTAVGSVSCELLVCSFSSAGSSDSDGTIVSRVWNFGDGNTSTEANPSHTYDSPGPRTVTLTVTDDDDAVNTWTQNINPTDVASPVAFVGVNHTNANRTNHAVTVPSSAQVGDALVLFFSANTTTPTYTPPAGWTQAATVNGSGLLGRAWTKVATAADIGAQVRVTSSAYAKSDMAVAVYRGTDGTNPLAVAGSVADGGTSASHTSPTVNAPAGSKWLVTYWADKTTATSAWTAPGGQAQRSTAFGTSGGHMSGLVVDSAADVSGSVGGLTATANGGAGRGVSFSVVLR